MNGCLRIDISEYEHVVVLVDDLTRNLSLKNFGKKGRHEHILTLMLGRKNVKALGG